MLRNLVDAAAPAAPPPPYHQLVQRTLNALPSPIMKKDVAQSMILDQQIKQRLML